jgi:hypothetical protein
LLPRFHEALTDAFRPLAQPSIPFGWSSSCGDSTSGNLTMFPVARRGKNDSWKDAASCGPGLASEVVRERPLAAHGLWASMGVSSPEEKANDDDECDGVNRSVLCDPTTV